MEECKFSVVIPLFNKEDSVFNTITKVLDQTCNDFEVIIVNDGSTDNSYNIVMKIKDPRIRVINQSNKGVSEARNIGISASKGRYICFLDADDEWTPDFLVTVENLFDRYPEAHIACPSFIVKYKRKILTPEWDGIDKNNDCLVTNFLKTATNRFWVVNSSCIAVKKDILESMDYLFPVGENVYEDFDLWFRLGVNNLIAHSPKICAIYNRISKSNARINNSDKVIYSNTFMHTLSTALKSESFSTVQKKYIKEIYDRRMVPFIFSLLVLKRRKEALASIINWFPTKKFWKFKYSFIVLLALPNLIIKSIQKIRFRIF